MPTYLLRCQFGSHRYYRIVRAALACTRDELPRELAWKANADPAQIVLWDCMPNEFVAASYGLDWITTGQA